MSAGDIRDQMQSDEDAARDDRYYALLDQALLACARYKPRFGQGSATTVEQFQRLYSADPFYGSLLSLAREMRAWGEEVLP